jgi:hypothetical protein
MDNRTSPSKLECMGSSTVAGIHYVTDEQGRRVAVQIDLKRHRQLWEDFYDGLIAESRRKEKSVPVAAVKARLGVLKRRRG